MQPQQNVPGQNAEVGCRQCLCPPPLAGQVRRTVGGARSCRAAVTRIPLAPPETPQLNLRGRIVTSIDLRLRSAA
jgi:hypothetical protein